jgi:putative ABC transport system ATP-binding protein
MLFEIKKLHFSYPGQRDCALELDSFSLKEGERVFVRGRSGTGKSTLLNLLSGVLVAPLGTLFYKGGDFSLMSATQRDSIRALEMGVIFQQFNLLPFLTASENVRLPFVFVKKQALDQEVIERSEELFDHLKLSKKLLDRPVRELSVGQQQRVAVVRALIHKPQLILADEPTSSLDTETRDDFIELLLKESQSIGAAVLFVSHDPLLEKHFEKTLTLATLQERAL